MKRQWKRLLLLIGVLSANCYAADQAEMYHHDTQIQSDCMHKSKPSCRRSCPKQKGIDQCGTCQEITPNAGPRVSCGANVFITADYILWKLNQDGMTIGLTGVERLATIVENFPSPPPVEKGFQKGPGFHWNSGFKVGIGVNLPHDGWDLFAEYTWLQSRSSSSIQGQVSPVTIAIPDYNQTKGRQRHQYNVINLELGRNFCISPFLTLRPHIGFSGTWQKVTFSNTFISQNEINVIGTPVDLLSVTITDKYDNKYWGAGIRIGLQTSWHFTTQWSIFGNLALTNMWSKYNLNTQLVLEEAVNEQLQVLSAPVAVENVDEKDYRVKFVNELEIGLRWEKWFSGGKYHFAAQIGWSEIVWVNHMVFIAIGERDHHNDMSLHGLDVKFRFDF